MIVLFIDFCAITADTRAFLIKLFCIIRLFFIPVSSGAFCILYKTE